MRQVIKHREIRPLKMIRRTDPVISFFRQVDEFVEIAEAHLTELLPTVLAVIVGIVTRNQGQADGNLRLQALSGQIAEVGYDLGVVGLAVAAVDVGREVFHVHVIVVNVGYHLLQPTERHVERRFHVDVPLRRASSAEVGYHVAAQQRLAAAEADAATRGLEIEVVDYHLLQDFLHRESLPHAVGAQALAVQTIAAVERTAVEGHQRGDARAVGSQTVTADSYERYFHFRRKVTGMVYFTATVTPFCRPGIHLGMALTTRSASASSRGSRLLATFA